MSILSRLPWILAIVLILPGCSSDAIQDDPDTDEAPVTEGTWGRPATTNSWYWQLQGNVFSEEPVDVYVVDLFATSVQEIGRLKAGSRKVLCYFSAGSYGPGDPDAESIHSDDLGSAIPGTNKERWLNVRSARLRAVMSARLETARTKGCTGVVPGRADNYLYNTGFTVNATHQLTYSRWLYNEAHRLHLTVGLVNNGGQVAPLLEYVDFAVAERCQERGDCALFTPFIQASKPVFNAEYKAQYATDSAARQAMCTAAKAANFRTVVLSPALDGSVRFSCDS